MRDRVSEQELERFLSVLDANPDVAAQRFLRIRSTLESFFEWRGCHNAESLTDIVFDRVIEKVTGGENINNIEAFCISIAKFVVLEDRRKEARMTELPDVADRFDFADNLESEELDRRRIDCLRQCLAELPADHRALVVTYFGTADGASSSIRQRLADHLKINLNSLRIRVSRLRAKLEKCVRDCCR